MNRAKDALAQIGESIADLGEACGAFEGLARSLEDEVASQAQKER